MLPSRTLPALLVCLLGLVAASPACAQFKWRDADGRITYSDQPPPPSVPDAAILKAPQSALQRPGPAVSAAPRSEGAPGPPGTNPERVSTLTAADREFEFRKRRIERAEAEKKAAESQARAQRAATACEESRVEVRTLESGMRVASVDSRGERVVADDSDRARRLESARRAVQEFCKG
jgi:hypothetical protein